MIYHIPIYYAISLGIQQYNKEILKLGNGNVMLDVTYILVLMMAPTCGIPIKIIILFIEEDKSYVLINLKI